MLTINYYFLILRFTFQTRYFYLITDNFKHKFINIFNVNIQNRFTSMVESDLVTVHSIIDECTVSSYRVAKLTDKFQILKDKAFGKGRLGELDVRAKILMGENNGQDYTKNEHGLFYVCLYRKFYFNFCFKVV